MIRACQTRGALLLLLLSTVALEARAQGAPQTIPGMEPPRAMAPAASMEISEGSEKRDFFVTDEQLMAVGVRRDPRKVERSSDDERSMLMRALQNIQPPPEDVNFIPSYGEEDTSILFSDDDAIIIREALDRVERIMASGGSVGLAIAERKEAAPVPQTGPVVMELPFHAYHVSSIIYRSTSDWMIWLNGKRVTPKINKGPVRVVGIGRDYVRLMWKPDHWEERLQVWSDKQPMSREIRKLQVPGSTHVDEQSQAIYATLRPNQTWVTATPVVVEGRHLEFEVTLKASDNIEMRGSNPMIKYSGLEAQKKIEELARRSAETIKKNSQRTLEEERREAAAAATAAQTAARDGRGAPGMLPEDGVPEPVPAPVVPNVSPQMGTPGLPPVMPEQAIGQPASLNDILSAISNAPPPSPTQ